MEIAQRKIKHLVVSGGSVWGFSAFGMLSQAITTGFLNMDDIQTIYSTSVGSIVCVMLALKIEHSLLKEYLIQRPWENVCKKNRCSVLEIFDNRGIC
jgi:patatin-like phospholipase/acyl hydrolase